MSNPGTPNETSVRAMLAGKTDHTVELFHHFIAEFRKIGDVQLHPAKTMIGLGNAQQKVAWVTQFGKNFIHVVFPFSEPYPDNLCFQKIAAVPDQQLRNNDFARLTDLALENDYADQSHFTRTFKAFTGLSPFKYRRRSAETVENFPELIF